MEILQNFAYDLLKSIEFCPYIYYYSYVNGGANPIYI